MCFWVVYVSSLSFVLFYVMLQLPIVITQEPSYVMLCVCEIHSICMYLCVHLPTLACLPEALDGTLFADVAFGLVLGQLCSSHTVEDGQPDHRLGLQAHPLQEMRHLNGRLPRGLVKEGGREKRDAGDCKQSKYRTTAEQVHKVMRGEGMLPLQRWSSTELLLNQREYKR